MRSKIFYTNEYKKLQDKIKNFLNQYPNFLTKEIIQSPRAVGDAIQEILAENFNHILRGFITHYSKDFARRSMADMAFFDIDNFYYIIDVKTHRINTQFNMPNLTSVDRLTKFYEEDKNYFVILMVSYEIAKMEELNIKKVHFFPIEFLSWECLTIGALGWGQIQIANANNIVVNEFYSRKKWMIELCDNILEFYPHEIEKIEVRMQYFKKAKEYWVNKKDD